MDAVVANNGPVPTLSIVAPRFNEQQVLPDFLRRVAKVCTALSLQYEIVLVDDGSRDATWDIRRMREYWASDCAAIMGIKPHCLPASLHRRATSC
jgi:cellulose synthase/poly-beta-1,6-N-acetylglucosamine synthase-like glycosyltransferase